MKRRLFSTALALGAMAAASSLPAWAQAQPQPSSRIGSLMQISVVDRAPAPSCRCTATAANTGWPGGPVRAMPSGRAMRWANASWP
jgi:hypothetical protein